MVPVTKPFLPPKDEYLAIIDQIWDRAWLTNNGPVLNDLEFKLKQYLGLEYLLVVGNGTIALQIAIKALQLSGEIITTPFSYVATTSSIVWENCIPVFVDIDAEDYNLDPTLLEAKITDKTTGILATHVFGNPCKIKAIQEIADRHGLKVIYDAAHCFGTKYDGQSVFAYGDVVTTSFHATKLFNTVEGGAVMTRDADLLKQLSFLRNFGHNGPETFAGLGINGKNSEFHAAMGVAILPYMDEVLERRREQWERYARLLANSNTQLLKVNERSEYNYSYFPVIMPNEEVLERTMKALNSRYIHPRRYFKPALNLLPYVDAESCPVAERVSNTVITLPLYHDLDETTQKLVIRIMLKELRQNAGKISAV